MKLLVCFLLSLSCFAQDFDANSQLFWEISGNGLKQKSYIYGNYHTNDRRVFQWSDTVYVALKNAQAIVLETDIFSTFDEWDTRINYVKLKFDAEGQPYTASPRASRTNYGDENGMPQFLDAYFHQYCLNSGKEFYGLETVQDQLDIDGDELQLTPSFDYFDLDDFLNQDDRYLKNYLKGDIAEMERTLKTSLSWDKEYYHKLIINRNEIMFRGMDTLMRQKSIFTAVGAGHLGGKLGIISLLKNAGYNVRLVPYFRSEEPTKERIEFLSYNSYKYVDSTGVTAIFPGKPETFNVDGVTNVIYREMGQGNTYHIEIIEKYDDLALEDVAADYIQSPRSSQIKFDTFDDGRNYAEGISDSYPEGLAWIRVIENENHVVVIKTYGGNKFMNSNRPKNFFDKVWFNE